MTLFPSTKDCVTHLCLPAYLPCCNQSAKGCVTYLCASSSDCPTDTAGERPTKEAYLLKTVTQTRGCLPVCPTARLLRPSDRRCSSVRPVRLSLLAYLRKTVVSYTCAPACLPARPAALTSLVRPSGCLSTGRPTLVRSSVCLSAYLLKTVTFLFCVYRSEAYLPKTVTQTCSSAYLSSYP